MNRYLFISIILLSFQGFNAQNSGFQKSKLDSFFDQLSSNDKFMGTIHIYRDTETIYSKSIGNSDLSTNAKNNDSTKYKIGSMANSIVAMIILRAVDKKMIQLNQSVGSFIPTVPCLKNVSFKNLMQHRSGLANFYEDSIIQKKYKGQFQEQMLYDFLNQTQNIYRPDSVYNFDNTNYLLLAILTEKIYKKPFHEILKSEITTPLRMKNTSISIRNNKKENEAYSYGFEEKWVRDTLKLPPFHPSNDIMSTPRDMILFSKSYLSPTFISKSLLDSIFLLKDNIGLGIYSLPFKEHQGFGHIGGIENFITAFAFFPQEKLIFSMMSNGANYDNNIVTNLALMAAFQYPYDIPILKTVHLSNTELDKYIGIYSEESNKINIVVTRKNDKLYYMAMGMREFPVEPIGNDMFKFDLIGLTTKFDLVKKTLKVNQGGAEIVLKKKD